MDNPLLDYLVIVLYFAVMTGAMFVPRDSIGSRARPLSASIVWMSACS